MADDLEAPAKLGSAKARRSRWTAVLTVGFALTALVSAMLGTWYLLVFVAAGSAGQLDTRQTVVGATFLAATATSVAGSIALMVMQRRPENLGTLRKVARVTLAALIVGIAFSVFGLGLHPLLLLYLYQLGWLIAFQLSTDPSLDRSTRFRRPAPTSEEERKGYIPLNFFNVFWVFMVASVLGLVIEVIYHAMVYGGYEDRAGVVWGPFSPIYGFGAALMTIALNRFWNRSALFIFVLSGLVGASFEWWVSFFMETAFGIVAWDYTGTFLSIGGRTNFAFFCAWGFLGMVWIKLLLPGVLRVVDAIPLTWRTGLTVVTAIFMLANGAVTLVALNSWYQRAAGIPQTTAVQQYFAEHFDDQFMAHRFQSMTLDASKAGRLDT